MPILSSSNLPSWLRPRRSSHGLLKVHWTSPILGRSRRSQLPGEQQQKKKEIMGPQITERATTAVPRKIVILIRYWDDGSSMVWWQVFVDQLPCRGFQSCFCVHRIWTTAMIVQFASVNGRSSTKEYSTVHSVPLCPLAFRPSNSGTYLLQSDEQSSMWTYRTPEYTKNKPVISVSY